MLIYANAFTFGLDNGPQDVIDVVAGWVARKARQSVDTGLLANGIKSFRLHDGSQLSSRVTRGEDHSTAYP